MVIEFKPEGIEITKEQNKVISSDVAVDNTREQLADLSKVFGQVVSQREIVEQPLIQKPKTTQVLSSAFALENTVASTVARLKNGEFVTSKFDHEFDAFDFIEDTKYEQYSDAFLKANNENDVQKIKNQIDREEGHREVLDHAGGGGIASAMIAGTLDPINLIPIGGTAYRMARTGKAVKAAVASAGAGFSSALASEGLLQSQQITRTREESAVNIGATTLLAGLLGGGATKLSSLLKKQDYENLASRVNKDIQRPESQIQIDESGNLSAAKVIDTTLDQETLAGGKITQAVIKSTTKLNPMLRVLNSNSKNARRTLQRLVRTNMYFKKNFEDIASDQSVEIAIKSYDSGLGSGIIANRNLFKKAKKRLRVEGKKITAKEFNDKITEAMIKGDVSDIPEVQAAAQNWRNKVFNPLKDQAIKQGLLPADIEVKTADSYLMRKWNRRKIIQHEEDFRGRLDEAIRGRLIPQIQKEGQQNIAVKEKAVVSRQAILDKQQTQFQKLRDELRGIPRTKKGTKDFLTKQEAVRKAQEKLDIAKSDVIDAELELRLLTGDEEAIVEYSKEIQDSIINNLRGIERKGVTMPYDMKIAERGPAKERTLNFVRDEEIRDFLDTDIEDIAKSYTNTLATDVELKRSFGNLNLEDQFKEITEEYNELRAKAKTGKEAQALSQEEEEIRQILGDLKDILRGNYGRPDNPDSFWPRAFRISRQIQYMSKLGGVAISSLPDLSRHVMVHGFNRVFGKGVKNLITNMRGVKLSIKDAKIAGNVLESTLHSRIATLSDIGDPYASGSSFERFLESLSNKFSKVNLLDQWNEAQKGFSSIITQQRLIEDINLLDAGTLKKNERAYLALLGIDKDNVNQIAEQLRKHSFKEKDLLIANLSKWDNAQAARIYKNALNTDVDRTIVTKGVGDIPLLMNKELGKVIGQFKSFAFAAHQQVTIAGMQQKDLAALSGISTIIAMGMGVYWLKQKAAGREVSDDPITWFSEGVDRSGIIPVIAEMNGIADAFGLSFSKLTGRETLSRFAVRNNVGKLLGPSFGSATDISIISNAVLNGELKESDIKAIKRNIPYQNVFYLRTALQLLEKSQQ